MSRKVLISVVVLAAGLLLGGTLFLDGTQASDSVMITAEQLDAEYALLEASEITSLSNCNCSHQCFEIPGPCLASWCEVQLCHCAPCNGAMRCVQP